MIVDTMIDESTAKYMCMFAGFDFKKAKEEFEKAKESKSDTKKAVQLAVDVASKQKSLSEQERLDEGFFSKAWDAFLNAPPAWVEEPTGFNDPSPAAVFKDDVKGGIRGYNKGAAMAAATAAAVIGRRAIPHVARAAVKHPVAAAVTAAAVTHPKQTAKVLDAGVEVASKGVEAASKTVETVTKAAETVEKHKGLLDTIAGFFAPVVDFAVKYPALTSALGATCYGLLQTYPLWWPYMRRLNYELTSGHAIAKCEFEANDQSWTFEYSLRKGKWALLSRGKIASQEDAVSFSQTHFAKKFIGRCAEIMKTAFDNEKYISTAAMVASKDDSKNAIAEVLEKKSRIESTMFTGKIIA